MSRAFGRGLPAAALGLLLLLAPAGSPAATNIPVCTLRALENALAVGGHITFDCDGTITLVRPLEVTKNAKLDATGRNVVLSGRMESGNLGPVQIFRVAPGVRLSLTNLTLVNGSNTNGGAIYNAGTLIASDCVFSNNFAIGFDGADGAPGEDGGRNVGGQGGTGGSGTRGAGGALYNAGSALLLGCTFTTNSAFGGDGGDGGTGGDGDFQGGDGGNGGAGGSGLGGAIYSAGSLTVSNCSFLLNQAVGGQAGRGGTNGTGAIESFEGHGGAGGAALGGAVYSLGFATNAGCTFAYNQAFSGDSADAGTSREIVDGRDGPDGSGGAMHNWGTNLLVNCTFYANRVTAGQGGQGADSGFVGGDGGDGGDAWGGNYGNSGLARMTNCTFSSGLVFPGSFGAGGAGFSGTNGMISYAGDDGSPGESRGANVGSQGGSLLLVGCLLDRGGTTTNVTAVTNVTTTVSNRVVQTTNISDLSVILTNSTCAIGARCVTNLIVSSTRVPTSETRFATNTYVPVGCVVSQILPICQTNVWVAEFTLTSVPVSTNYVTNITYITNVTTDLNAYGTIADGGYNLSDDSSPAFTSASSRNSLDVRLGPWGDYGGATRTLPLLPNSPAIDQIPASLLPPTDQRGIPRPVGSLGDIGAYEHTGLTLSGRVTASGGGLAGVTLTAGQKTATTDVNGDYTIFGLKLGATKTVVPSLADHVFDPPSQSVTVAGITTGVDFRAFRLFSIRGRIAQGGVPVAGVQVTATNSENPTKVTATTGADGAYVLAGVPGGSVTVRPSSDLYDFQPANRSLTLASNVTDLEFAALPVFTLSGRVTHSVSGVGLLGVRVTSGGQATTTDTNGGYQFLRVRAGTYTVFPELTGYTFNPSIQGVTLGPGTNVDFTASGIYRLSGRVTNTVPGSPPTTFSVTVSNLALQWTSQTAADGSYAFQVGAGPSVVRPALPGWVFAPATSAAISIPPERQDVHFSATLSITITGRVADATQVPLSNVLVTAGLRTSLTDTNGYYALTNVPAGPLVITPTRAGYGFDPAAVTTNLFADARLDFTHFPVFTLGGRITNSTGLGATNISVAATSPLASYTNQTGSSGVYTIPGLRPGTYEVTPLTPGYRFAPASRPSVVVQTNVGGIDFTADGAYSLVGQITNSLGAGVAGVAVTVNTLVTNTDAGGGFVIANLGPGNYTVLPRLARHVFDPAATNVAVTSAVATVSIRAIPVYNISGRVTEGSNALPLVSLSVTGFTSVTTTTDFGGYYTLASVAAGTNTVRLVRSGYGFDPTNALFLDLQSDTNLDFTATRVFSISGRVTEGFTGLSNVTVTLNTDAASVVTDAGGNYAFANLRPQTYLVAPVQVGSGPMQVGVGFNPSSSNVTVEASSVAGVNFTANRVTLTLTLTNGQAQVSGVGVPTRGYQVQASTNLGSASAWQTLSTVVAGTNGQFQYLDRAATNLPARAYRSRTVTP